MALTLSAMEGLECTARLGTESRSNFPEHLAYAHLIDKVLAVVIAQVLRADYSVQIRFHQLLDKVHLLEILERRGLNNI